MTERPILFSGPMVRAISEGRKTQTRRLVGLDTLKLSKTPGYDWTFRGRAPVRSIAGQRRRQGGCWQDLTTAKFLSLCPYGQAGDRLWVRETWCLASPEHPFVGSTDGRPVGPRGERCYYRATDPDVEGDDGRSPWRPSIFMPRWASRITLEITDVRVQRLQEISEEGAKAEGCKADDAFILYQADQDGALQTSEMQRTARGAFAVLWDSINAKRTPWASNPWVWAISFERRRRLPHAWCGIPSARSGARTRSATGCAADITSSPVGECRTEAT